jgi:hypothetical protein
MGNPFSYHVSFRVTHPKLGAAAIAAGLGMSPKACWTAGDARVTSKGTSLGGVRDESYCTFDIGEGEDGELAKCLDLGLSKLEANKEFSSEVRATGGSLMFYALAFKRRHGTGVRPSLAPENGRG